MTGCNRVILSMDTATGPCSVALWKNGSLRAYLENLQLVKQSASLQPMIEQALEIAGVNYKELTHVACTVGPGSFTGIRVGLAAARGICFAAGVQGIGFTTLETVAYGHKSQAEDKPILAILNAGKGEVYYQAFIAKPDWHALYAPRLGSFESAIASVPATAIIAGNASAPITFPRADALAALAAERSAYAKELSPYYIREPDAKPMKVDS